MVTKACQLARSWIPPPTLATDPSFVHSPQKFTRVIMSVVGAATNTTPVMVGPNPLTHVVHLVAVPAPLVDSPPQTPL
jgi:hypothetical protein